jgi:hypothetical protein
MSSEAVIASTPARFISRELDGVLVLTTTHLSFVVADEVHFEIARADIGRAEQDYHALWVYCIGEPGMKFELRSAFAGPVRWDWHLSPPLAAGKRELPASASDPRVGPIDAARRAVLDRWYEIMNSWTVTPVDHYFDDLPRDPVPWTDIVEIVYIVDGDGDGPPWLLVVRLADGRWVYFNHILQISGEVYTTVVVARSLETLWWGALTEEDRDRVTAQMTRDRLDDELVKLDSILESGNANMRAHAEQRMVLLDGGGAARPRPAQ